MKAHWWSCVLGLLCVSSGVTLSASTEIVFMFRGSAQGDHPRAGDVVVFNVFNIRRRVDIMPAIPEVWIEFDGEGEIDVDNDENPNADEIEYNNEVQVDDNQEEDNHDINENHNSLDNNDGIIDNNNEDAEVSGCSAWVEVGVNQGDEEDPLPGVSWKRSREVDREDIEERSSKKRRWRDKSAESSTDSDTDFNGYHKKTVNDPKPDPEDDPLPGPSKKRKRKINRVDEGSSKKSRWRDKSAESSTNSDTDFNGYHKKTVNDPDPEDDPLPGPSKKRKRKTNRVDEGSSKKSRWRDKSAESSTDSDTDFNGYHNKTVNDPKPEEDPMPGVSWKRSREDDRQDIEERSSKKRRWRDKSAESSTNSDTDFNGYHKKTVNDPKPDPEDDPLPGPSKKRKRKTNRVDEGSSKKSRQCYEFTESNSDTVTVTTGHDLPHSSGNIEISEDAGAAEIDKEEEEKDPRPGRSRKRKDDEEEDMPDRKQFKR